MASNWYTPSLINRMISKTKRVLILVNTLIFINLFLLSFNASAQVNRVVVWDGEQVTRGVSWTNPKSNSLKPQTKEVHGGNTALEFKFKGDGSTGWIGAGWDWESLKVGPYGTDITEMKNFSFWLKVTGTVKDFSFNLLCNDPEVMDQPQNHTEKVVIADYYPQWNNGEWHHIVIPLSDLEQPEGFDPRHVAEFQFFNTGGGKGSFFIDDIAFDNRDLY